jgi:plastocyanin
MRIVGSVAPIGSALLALALACSKGERPSSGETSSTPAAAPAAAPRSAEGATITGEVKFVGKPPTNPPIDMSEEPKCKAEYTSPPHAREVTVNANGTLADVFVYVKAGLPAGASYTAPTTPVVIDQKACEYHPRTFGIMVGQQLEIRNSDPLLHNIKALGKKNRPFNISQPGAGMTTNRSFTTAEVMVPIECNVHSWMHAYAGVLPHPFFSTTGSEGQFTIKGLPAGSYLLEAWHNSYAPETTTVTVQDNEVKAVVFTFKAQ